MGIPIFSVEDYIEAIDGLDVQGHLRLISAATDSLHRKLNEPPAKDSDGPTQEKSTAEAKWRTLEGVTWHGDTYQELQSRLGSVRSGVREVKSLNSDE